MPQKTESLPPLVDMKIESVGRNKMMIGDEKGSDVNNLLWPKKSTFFKLIL